MYVFFKTGASENKIANCNNYERIIDESVLSSMEIGCGKYDHGFEKKNCDIALGEAF